MQMPQVQEILYVCLSSADVSESNIAFPKRNQTYDKGMLGSVFFFGKEVFVWQDVEEGVRIALFAVERLTVDVAFSDSVDVDPIDSKKSKKERKFYHE